MHNSTVYTVRLDAFSNKLRLGLQNEISLQAFIHEMKFIALSPHIAARTGEGISLTRGIVSCRAAFIDVTNITLSGKNPKRVLLRKCWHTQESKKKKNDCYEFRRAKSWSFH